MDSIANSLQVPPRLFLKMRHQGLASAGPPSPATAAQPSQLPRPVVPLPQLSRATVARLSPASAAQLFLASVCQQSAPPLQLFPASAVPLAPASLVRSALLRPALLLRFALPLLGARPRPFPTRRGQLPPMMMVMTMVMMMTRTSSSRLVNA